MPLTERAAFGVLARKPDRNSLGEQGCESQRFGMGPIDSAIGTERRSPPLELLAQLGMDGETLGPAEELLVERDQELGRQRRVDFLSRAR